mgnify:CR=1 FL=1
MAGPFAVLYHAGTHDDLDLLPRNLIARITRAADERLSQAPDRYGERLRKALKGFWKLRVGDHRVIYEISGREVRVFAIMNRRDVYDRIMSRLSQGWR